MVLQHTQWLFEGDYRRREVRTVGASTPALIFPGPPSPCTLLKRQPSATSTQRSWCDGADSQLVSVYIHSGKGSTSCLTER